MSTSAKILIVEDDPGLGRGLCINLETEKFSVEWAQNLKLARENLLKSTPHLILLDLNLPDGNGISFLREIRSNGILIPVIILTARTEEDSLVEGFQAGANDYVKKPFSQRELLVRIRAAIREVQRNDAQYRYGLLQIRLDKRKIFHGETELNLNRREYDILHYFITHAESVVTRDMLLKLFDKDGEIFDRTIDSHVSHVRTKLKKANVTNIQISSVYGVGYRLETTVANTL